MHTVVRVYSGKGAGELIDTILSNKPAIEALMRSTPGFGSYSIVKSENGGFTVTVCADEKASDAITTKARDWVRQNAAHIQADAPQLMGGVTAWHLT